MPITVQVAAVFTLLVIAAFSVTSPLQTAHTFLAVQEVLSSLQVYSGVPYW